MYSNVFQRFDVVGTYLSEEEKSKRLLYSCSPSSQIYKENVVYVGLLCNLFAVFFTLHTYSKQYYLSCTVSRYNEC